MKLWLFLSLFLSICALNPIAAIAQEDMDEGTLEDNYDPFADYSEFTEATTEESDINFFKNGRMLSVGGSVGFHTLTGEMGKHYTRDPMFGIYLTYFFDLRFAIQGGFFMTTHDLSIPDGTTNIDARVRLNTLSIHAKHFFNTQNMTRSFGELNPYIIGGFSQIFRHTSRTTSVLTGNDGALGFDFGFGMEYMFNRRKNFIGFTVMYQYADFPNENTEVPSQATPGTSTRIKLSGDVIYGLINIGINF